MCFTLMSEYTTALMQDGQPISYASRVMTDTEQNYAQIEKELLAIVFAYERFNDYIYGRNVVHVETDHKPLESIFKKEIHMAPKRLQRTRLRLQKCQRRNRKKKAEIPTTLRHTLNAAERVKCWTGSADEVAWTQHLESGCV